MVYLAKKGNEVVHHTSKKAMLEMDGIAKADLEISDAEFARADYLARIIDGEIVLGKTEAEKKAEEAACRIRVLKKQLSETDYIAAKIAEGAVTKEEYADKIAQRNAWREEIRELDACELT